MRSSRMRLGRRHRFPTWVLIILGVCVVLFMFEAYRLVMPFVARNPLYHEVNFGQKIIDDWEYEGEDPEGYLQFYNEKTGEPAILPPNSKLFGADGKWVVIERADAASLTYAEPLESAPPYWYLVMLGIVGGFLWFMIHRRKVAKRGRMNLAKSANRSLNAMFGGGDPVHVKTKRFRPARTQKRRRYP
ncbi:hypothetical protein [Alicyclobacillus acidiphilus]|uniref:hypothetical protein n=1 Tax=Alicyclobacillus acidiphilus TaxID=182455 RepID=UPI0008300695|nr:hypothetical protein [Alicyclobacillus acidiphilus]